MNPHESQCREASNENKTLATQFLMAFLLFSSIPATSIAPYWVLVEYHIYHSTSISSLSQGQIQIVLVPISGNLAIS